MKWDVIFKGVAIISAVGAWFEKSMRDGKIDAVEAGELVTTIGQILGFKVEVPGMSLPSADRREPYP